MPGGRVDAEDNGPSGFTETLHPAVAAALLSGGSRRPALAFPRAALRETLEETGLLVGKPGGSDQVADLPANCAPIWQAYRQAGLAPDFGTLDFICRAITPVPSEEAISQNRSVVIGWPYTSASAWTIFAWIPGISRRSTNGTGIAPAPAASVL